MGESDLLACGPPASLFGQQCSHSGGVCPQIQWLQCGAYVDAVEEMRCVVYVSLRLSGPSDNTDSLSLSCLLYQTQCSLHHFHTAHTNNISPLSSQLSSKSPPMCTYQLYNSFVIPYVICCLEIWVIHLIYIFNRSLQHTTFVTMTTFLSHCSLTYVIKSHYMVFHRSGIKINN